MSKIILNLVSGFFLSLLVFSTILFPFPSFAALDQLPEGDNGNNPLQIVIEPSKEDFNFGDEQKKEDINLDDLLGSEQVFPFEAGFGKNSGKS